jgi:antitoxin MazE
MRTRIVKIGNSQGIRIPKALLEQTNLHGEVEISVRRGTLVISAAARARSGWDDAFRQMAACGDDRLLDGDILSAESFDARDWEWT